MTRQEVIKAIEDAFDCIVHERCGSASERKDVLLELEEVLTWIKKEENPEYEGFKGSDAVEEPEPLLQFFAYEHLKPELQQYSAPFGELAKHLCVTLPRNPERTVALRKLLEAKDCAVRARLYERR